MSIMPENDGQPKPTELRSSSATADFERAKPLWPWVALHTLPSIAAFWIIFTTPEWLNAYGFQQMLGWFFGGTFLYGFVGSFCFFRLRQRKSRIISFFSAWLATLLIVILNSIYAISIFFAGCLCTLSGHK